MKRGERLQRLSRCPAPTRCTVAKSLPLAELARRLQSCRGFVGHDSGITHLAAAVGLPCVVLWANTVEEIWRPQGERVQIIREISGLANLSVARVAAELSRPFPPQSERRTFQNEMNLSTWTSRLNTI